MASAKVILNAIASWKLDTIDGQQLSEVASEQGITKQLAELHDFLKGVSGLDLGSGRLKDDPTFVKVADSLVNGQSVPTSDLRQLLQAISEGE